MKGIAIAAGLLIALLIGLFLALQPVSAPELPPPTEIPPPVEVPLETHETTSHEDVPMVGAWPFRGFEDDLRALRYPVDPPGSRRADRLGQMDMRIRENKFTVRGEFTVNELVDHLAGLGKSIDVEFTTLGEELLPGKRFEVYLTDRTLWEYVDVIRAKVEPGGGDPSIEYFFVPGAICVGTRGTIEEFQIRHAESEALARAAPDRESALLDATFRPDFQEASWATVANVISQATQIQIIVDADLWSGTRTITWRAAEPLTLREVMDRLGKEMRAIYRVKDGRIFVFPR